MSLCSELKEIVTGYLHTHPNMSVNALAMKSKIGASTLRRIINESIKGEPSPHTVLNLVSAITKEKSIKNIINNTSGEVGTLLKDSFEQYTIADGDHELDQNLDNILKDPLCYIIYKLSANVSGISKQDIISRYGNLGLEKIKLLQSNGFILEDSGKLVAKTPDYSTGADTALENLPYLVQFFKLSDVKRGLNLFYTLSESLNESGIKKIKEIEKEAVTKIYKIMREKQFQGEVPYFTITMSDTMEIQNNSGLLQ